jgi:hypothetical protein
MTDQKIDEQLRRLSRAVAETSPEPPELASDSPRPRGVRPVRASSWGFTAALASPGRRPSCSRLVGT